MRPLPLLSIILIGIVLTASNCKKNKPDNPSDQLPPETQTGANTFGCLIDGKVFIPKGNSLSGPVKKAQYQENKGGYYLGISGRHSTPEEVTGVQVFSDSTQQLAVGTFELTTYNENGKYSGSVSEIASAMINSYRTDEINRGQLVIKKFDSINQIISGTFWFDAKNSAGQIVQVREGRFDMMYVR